MANILQTIETDLSKIRVTVTPQDVSRIVDGALPPDTRQAIGQRIAQVTGADQAEKIALISAGAIALGLVILALVLGRKKGK